VTTHQPSRRLIRLLSVRRASGDGPCVAAVYRGD
jgi:hypothetical protein